MSETVREAAKRYRNWGKWGPDAQRFTPEVIRTSARMVKRGVTSSWPLRPCRAL